MDIFLFQAFFQQLCFRPVKAVNQIGINSFGDVNFDFIFARLPQSTRIKGLSGEQRGKCAKRSVLNRCEHDLRIFKFFLTGCIISHISGLRVAVICPDFKIRIGNQQQHFPVVPCIMQHFRNTDCIF